MEYCIPQQSNPRTDGHRVGGGEAFTQIAVRFPDKLKREGEGERESKHKIHDVELTFCSWYYGKCNGKAN